MSEYGDLLPLEIALYELMSMVSEDCYCAGWMDGTEFAIWDLIRGARIEWGQGPSDWARRMLDAVHHLSAHIDRWIIWEDHVGPKAVTRDEFAAHYQALGRS